VGEDAGNLPVDLPLARHDEGVGQTSRQSRQLCADAVCDWRHAVGAYREISAVGNVFHPTNLMMIMAIYEISSPTMLEVCSFYQENSCTTKDVVSTYG
jgi:hypothetical protein